MHWTMSSPTSGTKSTVRIYWPTDLTKQHIPLIFFSWIDLLLRNFNKLFNLKDKFPSKKKFSIPCGLPKSIIQKAAITSKWGSDYITPPSLKIM